MKKVRYATAAVGVLGVVPALGLAAPAATAAPRAPASTGKIVRISPDTPSCGTARSAQTWSPTLSGRIHYSRDNGCIGKVYGIKFISPQTGLWMRTRFYNDGISISSRIDKQGHIHHSNSTITWSSYPGVRSATQACEAIISARGTIFGGPVCEETGY
jgi:hypothetical protein